MHLYLSVFIIYSMNTDILCVELKAQTVARTKSTRCNNQFNLDHTMLRLLSSPIAYKIPRRPFRLWFTLKRYFFCNCKVIISVCLSFSFSFFLFFPLFLFLMTLDANILHEATVFNIYIVNSGDLEQM